MTYRPVPPVAAPAPRPLPRTAPVPAAATARRVPPLLARLSRPGLGILYAALFLLLTVVYGTSRGGHWGEVGAALAGAPDQIADAAGFRIRQIVINGRQQVSNGEILAALQFHPGRSLPFIDAAAARRRLIANPLVQDATVRKLYPDKIEITLDERHPFALWQHAGQLYVIADDGKTIEKATGRFANLPLVVGDGAASHAHEILDALAAAPTLKGRVYAAVRVGDRRWNLRLNNGLDVKLPAHGLAAAVQHLAQLDSTYKLLERDITDVDLRFAGKVTVRLSDEAAKAEAEARKKAKKKGVS
jgi:cell division protein FtsQ